MIFNKVVLPVPFGPIRATRSSRKISALRPSNRGLLPNDFETSFNVRTSFPLTTSGSMLRRMSALYSVGFSKTSILFKAFSRLSARLIDFSRLNCFNFLITSFWCLISCCWFLYSFRRIALIWSRFSINVV